MLIYTPDRQLHVLRIVKRTEAVETYICTDLTEEFHVYILNGFLQRDFYQELIPMVMEQKNDCFTDFVEYFSTDGIFWLLFRCYEGEPLLEKADTDNMEVRLEYVRKIMEQLLLQTMPVPFEYALLEPESLIVTKDDEIRFRYEFDGNFGGVEADFHDVELKLKKLVEKLLIPELAMRYSLKLPEFCRDLEEGGVYGDMHTIYAVYTEIENELLSQRGHLISHKPKFQFWEKCKQHSVAIKRVFTAAVVLLTGGVIIWQTFLKDDPEPAENTDLTQIGSVTIHENRPALRENATESTDSDK